MKVTEIKPCENCTCDGKRVVSCHRTRAISVPAHPCKLHGYGHLYQRCACGHEFCNLYWIACPSCHGTTDNNRRANAPC